MQLSLMDSTPLRNIRNADAEDLACVAVEISTRTFSRVQLWRLRYKHRLETERLVNNIHKAKR